MVPYAEEELRSAARCNGCEVDDCVTVALAAGERLGTALGGADEIQEVDVSALEDVQTPEGAPERRQIPGARDVGHLERDLVVSLVAEYQCGMSVRNVSADDRLPVSTPFRNPSRSVIPARVSVTKEERINCCICFKGF